jgi:hypothetical protein
MSIFGLSGGWDALAAKFRTGMSPAGDATAGNTIQVGTGAFAPIYKNCTVIAPSGTGLYIAPKVAGFLSLPPVVIPWHEVKKAQATTLYWNGAVALTIGDPAITSVVFEKGAFVRIRPYIDPAVLKNAGL